MFNMQEAVIEKLFEKGFGFLKVDGRKNSLFFHMSGLEKGIIFEDLKVGDTVSFRGIDITNKGEMAVGITNNK